MRAQEYVRDSEPQLFTYDELVELNKDQPLPANLAEKLHTLTTTPFINNEAYLNGARATPLDVIGLGPSLRVVFWNIEHGLELDYMKLFLSDPKAFAARIEEERKVVAAKNEPLRIVDAQKIAAEIETLKSADVWVLNEVDWGVKRSDYREEVRELAQALNMNWAYGVEFLEIDSKQLGLDTFAYGETPEQQKQLQEVFRVDKGRLRAMQGNAVLSRYPIRSARLVPFAAGYDWFQENRKQATQGKKEEAAVLIGRDLLQVKRRGQRSALYVDLDVPQAPGQRVTIVATHLEDRVVPSVRRLQLRELLQEIRDVPNPVIVAGDMSTSRCNMIETNPQNLLYKRYGNSQFWITDGVPWLAGTVHAQIQFSPERCDVEGGLYDPTLINEEPERKFLTLLRAYRTADGKAFDFRGVSSRTSNRRAGSLADSNERTTDGFTPTYATECLSIWPFKRRAGNTLAMQVYLSKIKVDWIFVKSELKKPTDAHGSFVFAPHFARTLVNLVNYPAEPLSDHAPMSVDLPFQAPVGDPYTPVMAASK